MHILLYVPDNQVARNFVPQLWPFLLKQRTPPGHTVTIIDGNAQPMTTDQIVTFVRDHAVDLVGLGFMTRMTARAYEIGVALRAAGVPVVFGGPHVTSLPGEALGHTGLPRAADAVVLGEADDSWREVVADAARGTLKDVYGPDGLAGKPTLEDYQAVDWSTVDLGLFDLMRFVPARVRGWLRRMEIPYEKAYVIPVESGRGCPYGCEFCTVTGFFGKRLRFRSINSVMEELATLKRVAARDRALVNVFFVDDNFAINRERLKALLREMIRRDLRLPWVGQISMNLLDDDELVELIGQSGGRFIFMGLESVEADSLNATGKRFNKPDKYGSTLERLARHGVYAVTSFIVGLDGDRPGSAARLEAAIATWPPVLPVFGILTPYPGTPLYDKLAAQGRILIERHWLDASTFTATFSPSGMTADEAAGEVREAWRRLYRPRVFARTQRWLVAHHKPFDAQVMFLVARLLFRGIYFPQMTAGAWLRLLGANSVTMLRLAARRLFTASAPPAAPTPDIAVVPATLDDPTSVA